MQTFFQIYTELLCVISLETENWGKHLGHAEEAAVQESIFMYER